MMPDWYNDYEANIPTAPVRTRFAPSPTGYMHIGNLRTALYTYLIARRLSGTFILRLEDTDQNRFVDDASDIIFNTLRECGLKHDEGPDIGGPAAPYIQSQRKDIYLKYARLLIDLGGAYYCFCNKDDRDISPDDDDSKQLISKYDGRCSRLSVSDINDKLNSGMPYVIRQLIPRSGSVSFSDAVYGDITVNNDTLDDNILIKSDGLPTYNFANVIDDHLMGITHVVRGSEYLSSAPKYILLYQSFGWTPPLSIHCPPVMRDARHKFSKRAGDPSYEDLIADGFLSQAILNYVALLGWSPGGEREIFSLSELSDIFDIQGISKSPSIFDAAKLLFFNAEYIRTMTPELFHQHALPYITQSIGSGFDTACIASLLQPRCERLRDIPQQIAFIAHLPDYSTELFTNKKAKTDASSSLSMLNSLMPVINSVNDWSISGIHDSLISLAQSLDVKNAKLLWPLRIAISGLPVTPGGAVELSYILGKKEVLLRVSHAISKLSTN